MICYFYVKGTVQLPLLLFGRQMVKPQRRASRPTKKVATTLDPSRPTAIPGVRIAHIGGSNRTVGEIRTYWQSRAATFMHHSIEQEHDQTGLGAILTYADIVFHSNSKA